MFLVHPRKGYRGWTLDVQEQPVLRNRKKLVWRKAVIIKEITAHPPNLTELFIFTTSKSLEVCSTWVDESIVIKIILHFGTIIGM